jgi:REP element-mobilizing transposase RayT
MPRRARLQCAGEFVHVMNRRVDRSCLFGTSADYRVFASILAWSQRQVRMEITAWVLMPNHWHLVLHPLGDGQLTEFMHRVQTVHAMAFRKATGTSGQGCVYGSRFKGFLIPQDRLLRSVVYVERNPVKASLVGRAQDWPHGSAEDSGDGHRSPLVTRLPMELERHRIGLLGQPLPGEFEASFQSACRVGVMGSPLAARQSMQRKIEAVRSVNAARGVLSGSRG